MPGRMLKALKQPYNNEKLNRQYSCRDAIHRVLLPDHGTSQDEMDAIHRVLLPDHGTSQDEMDAIHRVLLPDHGTSQDEMDAMMRVPTTVFPIYQRMFVTLYPRHQMPVGHFL